MPEESKEVLTTFKALGVCDQLVESCDRLGWRKPTQVQAEALPHAFEGKDLVGPVEIGSSEMGVFSIPILQGLFECPLPYFACVLTPTREIAFQIAQHCETLGSEFFVKCTLLVEGMDMEEQVLSLAKYPSIVVATPERLLIHLKQTRGFTLWGLKYLVLDKADRLLGDEFEKSVGEIMKVTPPQCRTYLFFATETVEVMEFRCTRLKNHVMLQTATETLDTTEVMEIAN